MMDNLKLMYIANRPDVARIAEDAGVDRIFVDMEYIGKDLRQGGMDTVQSHHTVQDVVRLRKSLKTAELMVRCNPIHTATADYGSSQEEIESIIAGGADVIMLPYFKTPAEVEKFVRLVDGRAKTFPLVETREAVECIDDILKIGGIDEIYIGLNDLSLSYGYRFMFQLLANGTVDKLAERFRNAGLPFGFGGIASLDKGMLPGRYVLMEHYRLGSSRVILSRSFCNLATAESLEQVNAVFCKGVQDIRQMEHLCKTTELDYEENHRIVQEKVAQIVEEIEGI